MIVAGVSALNHDAAVSVLDTASGEILFASHSERYSKQKNDPQLCQALIDEVKRFSPERVVWYERPNWKYIRRSLNFDFSFMREESPREHLRRFGLDLPMDYVDHHLAHAAAGAYTSSFDDAAVLVMDAIGEFATTTIWRYRDHQLERLFVRNYPQSFGLFYSAFTQQAGFRPNEEEYILMGLSAYGGVTALNAVLAHAFDVDSEFPIIKRNYHFGVGDESFNRFSREDIARATQVAYEMAFDSVLAFARRVTQCTRLVFMGGCALNCLANRLIRKHFEASWILPCPGDAGSSLGAAAAASGTPIRWRSPYLGHAIAGEYPVERALAALLGNQCVAVASGRAEFGPRALGNRSLLADPRGVKTKDNVNLLKKREGFRPFAPVVLEEHFARMFETHGDLACPYMQCVYRVKAPDLYPAITHVDGTARVQTLNRTQHPGLHELLTRFHAATGCPMLLNTSLNIKGMPLVNDTEDAQDFERRYGVAVLGTTRGSA